VKAGRDSLIASVDPKTKVNLHEEILLQANLENLHLFDARSEKALLFAGFFSGENHLQLIIQDPEP
jgi:hypothetical protein